MSSQSKIRTIMIDDSPEFLEAATRFLGIDPNIDVVSHVLRGADALETIQTLQPDVVLLDLAMTDVHGLEVMKLIQENLASPPFIIILTLYDNPEYRTQAKALGADGFIYKSDFGVELLPAIHRLFANAESKTEANN